MKRLILLFLYLGFCFTVASQDITGQWKGDLEVFGSKLPLVFHISNSDDGYSATMDSPAQQAFDIPIDQISFENHRLLVIITALNAEYSGKLEEDEFSGEFQQNNMKFPLDLTRQESTISDRNNKNSSAKRYQEPQKPYPYITEEVYFKNEEQNIELAGTLSLPEKKGKFPAVILITGSGPQNRDEEIMGHKPFLVISDYLTRQGIAVLRYDDRGVGQSGGRFLGSTTQDFSTDALAAFDFLKDHKEIDSQKIGLLGHSEGGLVAIMSAAANEDIAFIILLASPGVDGGSLLLKQQEKIGMASGVSEDYLKINKKINEQAYEIIRQEKDSVNLRNRLQNYFEKALRDNPEWNSARNQGIEDAAFIQSLLNIYSDRWMRFYIGYDPDEDLKKISCPVIALNGSKDLQVDARQNLSALKEALENSNKKNFFAELKDLNHLFQESSTGLPAEYGTIEQTISPVVLELLKEKIHSL